MLSTSPLLSNPSPRLLPVNEVKMDNLFKRWKNHTLPKIAKKELQQAQDAQRMKDIVLF